VPKPGPKAQATWAEFKESWLMILDIEREGLKLTEVEVDKSCDLIGEKLRQTERLVKERNKALKHYLSQVLK